MQNNPFQLRTPSIIGNDRIRTPQREAFAELAVFAQSDSTTEREVGIVLPVGCGKSGCITITPFAFRARRTLVVAPGVPIAEQLRNDFDPSRSDMFYVKCRVLEGGPFPEPVEMRGTVTNVADMEEADVVITNIHQLQGASNRWLQALPADFFDLIVFDEGHHNVADSWQGLRAKFPEARIVNFSATPTRLALHLLVTVARLAGPGGARSVVAESVLVKQQLLILDRARKRSPHLSLSDRMVVGLCALLMCPRRLIVPRSSSSRPRC